MTNAGTCSVTVAPSTAANSITFVVTSCATGFILGGYNCWSCASNSANTPAGGSAITPTGAIT
jgi:hypothetical protein